MRSGNLQYQSSGRGGDIVFSCCRILKVFSAVFTMIGALSLFLFWQVPFSFSQSQTVVINEIGWMGTQNSVNDEWMEIFNVSDRRIDLSGWRLKSTTGDNPDPDISLSGYIEPGGYCLFERTDDTTIPDVAANYIYKGVLNNDGERLELINTQGVAVDIVDAAGTKWFNQGDNVNKKSMERVDPAVQGSDPQNWRTSETSPGTPQSIGCSALPSAPPQQVSPAITFAAPATVSVGAPFSVSVTLKDFKAGTYSLKVLIGKGDKFYDGRTKGTNGEWLAWNAGWVDFPKVSVGSSGSGSKKVQAKTDDDVVAGNYLTKVRAYDGKSSFDSETKALGVTGTATSESNSSTAGGSSESGDGESSFAEATGDEGEVKGAGTSQGEGFKLNFYTILGIFGLLVGSGGLILAFRRGARRLQTPDTLESEPATPS